MENQYITYIVVLTMDIAIKIPSPTSDKLGRNHFELALNIELVR